MEILGGSSSRVKPFTLYHASKRLTFTTALQLRAGERLKCGGLGKKKKTLLKSLSGSTWLTDVKIVGKRKATAASITQGDKPVSEMAQRFFFLSLFFFVGPDNYPPVTEKPAELNKEAVCVCE